MSTSEYNKRYYKNRKTGDWAGKGTVRVCAECRTDFSLSRSDQRFCSAKCRTKFATRAKGHSYGLRKHYGISEEQYAAMAAEQGHVCAICKRACSTGQRLSVDHSHSTNQVRRLLCKRCNLVLGLMSDNAQLLLDAAAYLMRFSDKGDMPWQDS